jgi:cell division protein FtsN
MSRDMNKTARKRTDGVRKKSAGGTLIGLFVGLVIGVLIAAGVVWYIHRTPPPFTSKTQPPSQPSQPSSGSPQQQQPAGGVPQTPLALPGKPGDPIPQSDDKPRFDFYKILPGNGEGETPADPKPAATKPGEPKSAEAGKEQNGKENTLKEPVFLQAGSFQNAGDADNQKAKLAMMGMEAAIQQIMLQDKVWYRVRLGPFRKLEDVNALRAELARLGISANVVKKD